MSTGSAAKQRDEMQRCERGHLHTGIINTNPSCSVVIYFEILLALWSGAVDMNWYRQPASLIQYLKVSHTFQIKTVPCVLELDLKILFTWFCQILGSYSHACWCEIISLGSLEFRLVLRRSAVSTMDDRFLFIYCDTNGFTRSLKSKHEPRCPETNPPPPLFWVFVFSNWRQHLSDENFDF